MIVIKVYMHKYTVMIMMGLNIMRYVGIGEGGSEGEKNIEITSLVPGTCMCCLVPFESFELIRFHVTLGQVRQKHSFSYQALLLVLFQLLL